MSPHPCCLRRASSRRVIYGDNLDVIQRHVADASVDLVYLDPPFGCNADYNILFEEKGTGARTRLRRADREPQQAGDLRRPVDCVRSAGSAR